MYTKVSQAIHKLASSHDSHLFLWYLHLLCQCQLPYQLAQTSIALAGVSAPGSGRRSECAPLMICDASSSLQLRLSWLVRRSDRPKNGGVSWTLSLTEERVSFRTDSKKSRTKKKKEHRRMLSLRKAHCQKVLTVKGSTLWNDESDILTSPLPTSRSDAQMMSDSRCGARCITSWYPKSNGNHFGLPPRPIHRMTGMDGNLV